MKKTTKTRKPASRDAGATQAALIAVGREMFARNGYEGARTEEIAARARVNKAMISYYYGGKKGLYQEIILSDLTAVQAGIREAEDPSLPAGERLAKFVRALTHRLSENPDLARILVREQMGGSVNLEPRVWQKLMNHFLALREILQDGIRSGEFRKVDPHATHLSLVGGLIFYLITQPARRTYARSGDLPPTPEWKEYVDHQLALFLRGLQPEISHKRSKLS